MTDGNINELLNRLRSRRTFDNRWERLNFGIYQTLLMISIFASFGAAILAAADIVEPIIISLLAALPGTAIIIDRSFLFADRWRWHNAVATRFFAFEQTLLFEKGTVEQVSAEMSKYLIAMEAKYPSHAKTDAKSRKARTS